MKEINNEPKINVTLIKKLNVLNNEPKNDSLEFFNALRINEINNHQENFSFFVKKNKFKKSINQIINLSSFINCNSILNSVNINLIGSINHINNYCENYNTISSNVCHMISHYQNENNRDYTFNKYNDDNSEKDILNEYHKISEKLLKKYETKNNIKNDINNKTIKQNDNDIKKNPNIIKKNIKNYNNENLSIIPENGEIKKKKIQDLKKLKTQIINARQLTPDNNQMKKKNSFNMNNTMKVNYSKYSLKKEDLNLQNKIYNKNQINELIDIESMNDQ